MNILFDLAAFIVLLSIVYVARMWWIEWRDKFPVPIQSLARIFSVAFAIQGAIYLIFSFIAVDIEVRSYLVRVSISTICLSQAVPLHIAHKAWRDGLRS